VSFSYGERLILDNISFTIPAHKTYALVGMSGVQVSPYMV
jgi:ABC-type multidrug transport system fused ATPase/permease subunit